MKIVRNIVGLTAELQREFIGRLSTIEIWVNSFWFGWFIGAYRIEQIYIVVQIAAEENKQDFDMNYSIGKGRVLWFIRFHGNLERPLNDLLYKISNM